MKGSEWALNALRNFKDFIGVEEYSLHVLTALTRRLVQWNLICIVVGMFTLCVTFWCSGGAGAGAGANKTTVFKLGKKELL